MKPAFPSAGLLYTVTVLLVVMLSPVSTVSQQTATRSTGLMTEEGEQNKTVKVAVEAVRNASDARCPSGCSCPRRDIIICSNRDTLSTLPMFADRTLAQVVTELFIENQPRLTQIDPSILGLYKNLTTFTAQRSGISQVDDVTFRGNRLLRRLILRSNKLSVFPWTVLNNLKIRELDLSDNPIICNCSAKWLKRPRDRLPALDSPRPTGTCISTSSDDGTRQRQPPTEGIPTDQQQQQQQQQQQSILDYAFTGCGLPRLSLTDNVTVVDPGTDIDSTCTADGQPVPLRVYWTALDDSDVDILSASSSMSRFQESRRSERSSVLRLTNATVDSSSTMTCVAENSVGRTQVTWTILVNSPPTVLRLDEPIEAFHWNIQYEVTGYPLPNVTWLKDGLPLVQIDGIIFDRVTSRHLTSTKGSLIWTIASHNDNGNYTLIVENTWGRAQKTISASFLHFPPGGEVFAPVYFDDYTGHQSTEEDDIAWMKQTRVLFIGFSVVVGVVIIFALVAMVLLQRRKRHNCKRMSCCRMLNGGRCREGRSSVASRRAGGQGPRDGQPCASRDTIPLNMGQVLENPLYAMHTTECETSLLGDPTTAHRIRGQYDSSEGLQGPHRTSSLVQEHDQEHDDTPNVLPSEREQLFTQLMQRTLVSVHRIPRSKIHVISEIGEGAFGRVYLGTCERSALQVDHLTENESSDDPADPLLRYAARCQRRDPNPKISFVSDSSVVLVALKTIKEGHRSGSLTPSDGSSVEDVVDEEVAKNGLAEENKLVQDFEREAQLLTGLRHTNIVRFYGISNQVRPRMLVLEYMENGDLNNYLRSHGPEAKLLRSSREILTVNATSNVFAESSLTSFPLELIDQLNISRQIAAGAEYLASQHFIHRDLATRNCLVGNRMTVKIGDFGMSRDIYSTDYYKVGAGQLLLPIRWMPYESILYRTFTVQSDVWSFGVVLWEIFTHGKQPWYELSNHEVIHQIESCRTLDQPVNCPDAVYQLMLACWRHLPTDRLSMNKLRASLDTLYREELDRCEELAMARTQVDYVQPEKPLYCNQIVVSTSCDPVSTSSSSPGTQYLQLVSRSSGVE